MTVIFTSVAVANPNPVINCCLVRLSRFRTKLIISRTGTGSGLTAVPVTLLQIKLYIILSWVFYW
jgi:hypothetical protein